MRVDDQITDALTALADEITKQIGIEARAGTPKASVRVLANVRTCVHQVIDARRATRLPRGEPDDSSAGWREWPG